MNVMRGLQQIVSEDLVFAQLIGNGFTDIGLLLYEVELDFKEMLKDYAVTR